MIWLSENFLNRPAPGEFARVQTQLKSYVREFPLADKPGMLLLGEPGTGKTHLAVAVSIRAWWAPPAGGAVVGAGVAIMHFLGMSALDVPGHVGWSVTLVLASILIGIVLATMALAITLRRDTAATTVGGALLLTLAIAFMHFTAMGAVEIAPDPTHVLGSRSLSPDWLAIVLVSLACAVLGMSLIGAVADRRFREHNTHLAAALDNLSTERPLPERRSKRRLKGSPSIRFPTATSQSAIAREGAG